LRPIALAVGDFNGDGKPDLVTGNAGDLNLGAGGSLGILLGNGDGSFRPVANLPVASNPIAVAVGDFNKDGKLDVVAANLFGSSVSVFLGNGDGSFQLKGT